MLILRNDNLSKYIKKNLPIDNRRRNCCVALTCKEGSFENILFLYSTILLIEALTAVELGTVTADWVAAPNTPTFVAVGASFSDPA